MFIHFSSDFIEQLHDDYLELFVSWICLSPLHLVIFSFIFCSFIRNIFFCLLTFANFPLFIFIYYIGHLCFLNLNKWLYVGGVLWDPVRQSPLVMSYLFDRCLLPGLHGPFCFIGASPRWGSCLPTGAGARSQCDWLWEWRGVPWLGLVQC